MKISENKINCTEEEEDMETPNRSKRCQIATSITKFEESPVFNFLNSLSPIGPVRSIHISQTMNLLSFTSLPSVFTSPHVRESRLIRRHQLSDPLKPEFSSDDQTTLTVKKINMDVEKNPLGQEKENVNPGESNDGEISYDCSKFVVDFQGDYECKTLDSGKAKEMVDYGCSSLGEENMEVISQVDQDKEGVSCDWDNMMDGSDLLIFKSPVVEGSVSENLHRDGSEVIYNDGGNEATTSEKKLSISGLYRGMRRRCLLFEMGGAKRKNLDNNNTSSVKAGNESSHCILPSIGLHLNALAATPKDSLTTSRRLLIGPIFHSSNAGQNELLNSVASSLDSGMDRNTHPVEDAGQVSGCVAIEEINPCSPKKKRHRVEQDGNAESCKRCNCKKSKCLKLYCECFAAGVYCVEPCACIDCFNKPTHEDTVLQTRKQIESRNPLAFAPKVIRGAGSITEIGDDPRKTPASARHKQGCNCKKSGCLKKYCECYQGGVGCSINCRCEGCKNAFGRKDGSGTIIIEAKVKEYKMDTTEKIMLSRNLQKRAIENAQETDELPKTPLRASSYNLENKQSEKVAEEDEIPDFLQVGGESSSPVIGIKSSSPNQKRVSPPRSLRSSRKLILQSIPSFPSLAADR